MLSPDSYRERLSIGFEEAGKNYQATGTCTFCFELSLNLTGLSQFAYSAPHNCHLLFVAVYLTRFPLIE